MALRALFFVTVKGRAPVPTLGQNTRNRVAANT